MPTPTNKKLSNAKMIALKPISSHVAAPAVEASKHKRFGSEEPEPFLSTAPEITEIFGDSSDDSNDDDSDDAPEEYNQETAVKDHVAQDQDAIKAIEIQKAALREKRKERDAKLTQQAEVANRKRKRNESSKQASSMKKLKAAESVAEAEDTMNIAVEDEPAMSVSRTHKFLTNDKLPEFLPAEFLQGDESEYEDTAPTTQAMIRKTTKRVVPVVKKPKDRQKGSTIYRVTETVDSRLAPKASLHARSEKARKMHGGNRKPFANGFFTSA
ncbi:hypothetical protein BJ878DRAFT_416137 [Calycina marina]|uniref:Uncharacterized protein n=1 Tax=Calycina marina TaxID=1763456 RepID=A0A9P7Z7N7_9HELO|nr:hypothetical protein BJ878DRAFT_416137 [Calycina marina]